MYVCTIIILDDGRSSRNRHYTVQQKAVSFFIRSPRSILLSWIVVSSCCLGLLSRAAVSGCCLGLLSHRLQHRCYCGSNTAYRRLVLPHDMFRIFR
jgi:hypothetical protein